MSKGRIVQARFWEFSALPNWWTISESKFQGRSRDLHRGRAGYSFAARAFRVHGFQAWTQTKQLQDGLRLNHPCRAWILPVSSGFSLVSCFSFLRIFFSEVWHSCRAALVGIQHEKIPKNLEVARLNLQVYMLLELLPGGDLYHLLRQKPEVLPNKPSTTWSSPLNTFNWSQVLREAAMFYSACIILATALILDECFTLFPVLQRLNGGSFIQHCFNIYFCDDLK